MGNDVRNWFDPRNRAPASEYSDDLPTEPMAPHPQDPALAHGDFLRNRRLADALAERQIEDAPPAPEQPMHIRNLNEEEAAAKAATPREILLNQERYMQPVHVPQAPTSYQPLPDWIHKEQETQGREQLKSTALHLWKMYQSLRGRK